MDGLRYAMTMSARKKCRFEQEAEYRVADILDVPDELAGIDALGEFDDNAGSIRLRAA